MFCNCCYDPQRTSIAQFESAASPIVFCLCLIQGVLYYDSKVGCLVYFLLFFIKLWKFLRAVFDLCAVRLTLLI